MFLLALLLGGIAFVILHGSTSKPRPDRVRPSTATQPTASTTTTTRTVSSTGCSLPAGSQAIPSTSPPTGTMWATVGAMQAPQAPTVYGPQRTKGIWDTCFAHNPTGALLAAINLWAEGTTTAPASAVFQRLAVGAPRDLGSNENLDAAAGGAVQLAGYKYGSYTPANAQISVVLQGPQGTLVAFVTPMTWHDGDWKYVFPTGGTPSYQVIPALAGYVPWSDF